MFWKDCKDLQNEIVANRRELHQIPELGQNLPETQAYVLKKLDEYGIKYKTFKDDSGIVAEIEGGKKGKTVAIRADMDALPILEATGLPFTSKHKGLMHACGHDAHIAMLLCAGKVLNNHKAELNGNVRLIFQTAEEIAKGSKAIIANGGIEGVDAIFGNHIGSLIDKTIPTGKVLTIPGPVMAFYDKFIIKVKGVGCHGSTPEKGICPVNIAAHIVLGLENIIAREFNACTPAVVTIGKIHGGEQYNAIPSEVLIEGTTRGFDDDVRKQIAKRIEEIAKNTAAAFNGTVDFEMEWGAPPVINNVDMAKIAEEAAVEVVGKDDVITSRPSPNMAGEDFAEYLQKIPGAFMFLSSSNPAKHTDVPHHNPKFDVDEDVMWIGSAVFVNIVEKFLNK